MPITIEVTLPDELAEQAKAKGLLSSDSLAKIIGEALRNDSSASSTDTPQYPEGMDPRLAGAVNPKAFQRGKIVGDIISPIDVEWEANQ